ncbi:MAG: hypothetical protein IT429_13940 [Gemmataceae bacterium]|nr:hypothetical protein [Gemmataceae bacterium]
MDTRIRWAPCLAAAALLAGASRAPGQSLRVSFDAGLRADRADGRADPWVSRGVELVAGRFGKAVRVGPGGQLIYAAERNFRSGRGTLACWCRIPERPGPLDVQRLVFVQAKERGYWTALATLEWQESAFRAMVFDFYHGHGWHDPAALPAFKAETWHHVALVWDQGRGAKFFLDGKLLGSTWDRQAWWERPTPHAIHLSYPGAAYDELCVHDRPLTDAEIGALARANRWQVPDAPAGWDAAARDRLVRSLGAVGLDRLPRVELAVERAGSPVVIRQARVRQILDDRIPAWKVVDGRLNLFWPEWRAPTLGDVDYSGSELRVAFEPGQELTHLILRGLAGGCVVHGERGGYVSRAPVVRVPAGLHFLAADRLLPGLTGLRVPRREGMKLHEIVALAVDATPGKSDRPVVATPLTGRLEAEALQDLADDLRVRTLPEERLVLGKGAGGGRHAVPALSRVHFITEPVAAATPVEAVGVRLRVVAPWRESVWWLRVQDPVNPRRDLMHVPLRVVNPAPGRAVTFDVVLDFWDVMLDPGTRLWVELLPHHELHLVTGEDEGALSLWSGDRARVLKEFGHTQSQLAYSYWQLGSEANGTGGSDPAKPGFALLGSITHNRELKLTMEWVRRHIPDQPLVNDLWQITHAKAVSAPVVPRLRPAGAPDWAVWGRELLERFRTMAHHWADRQGPDGQLGGGWNDDTDFPGVFLCLPLLGDRKTQTMYTRIFDGLEETGYLANGVARGPIDALHATDFLSWRAHLMLFDYGEPRHVERALTLTRELHRWTVVDRNGHRRFRTGFYSEDGPGHQPATEVGDGGLIEPTGAGRDPGPNRNFLRDPLFCAWYARNPAVLKFVREVAKGDYARAASGAKLGAYEAYPFYSYFVLLGDRKYLDGPAAPFLRDRWSLPIWRRFAERLPDGKRLDAQLLKGAAAKAPTEEQLTAAYLVGRDRKYLVRALRAACARLEGGWQFRGGAAGGANDHFHVPGQAALSQLYLGSALTWLRPASILPPLAVSWDGLEADVAAHVLQASPQELRVALYNFADRPRQVRMRVWELAPGTYRLRAGSDADQDDRIDGPAAERELPLQRASWVDLELPPRQVHLVELRQAQARPRPELLADLAVGKGDVYYDRATDRLKVVVHNIGAAAAEKVVVRFETADGTLLAERVIAQLEAPLDLRPRTAVVWLPQPLLHPTATITVRIDPESRVDEITRANNQIVWPAVRARSVSARHDEIPR